MRTNTLSTWALLGRMVFDLGRARDYNGPYTWKLLEEIQVTWAHLEKKRTRLQLYTKVDEEMRTVAGDSVTFIGDSISIVKRRR
ncbi:hypothetical protein Tco_0428233 [Tanacetum coccineum]